MENHSDVCKCLFLSIFICVCVLQLSLARSLSLYIYTYTYTYIYIFIYLHVGAQTPRCTTKTNVYSHLRVSSSESWEDQRRDAYMRVLIFKKMERGFSPSQNHYVFRPPIEFNITSTPKAQHHMPNMTWTRHHCAQMPCRTAQRSAVLRRMRCLCTVAGLQGFGYVVAVAAVIAAGGGRGRGIAGLCSMLYAVFSCIQQ